MTPDDPLDDPVPPGPAFDLLAAIDAMGARVIAAVKAIELPERAAPEYVLDVTSKFADGRIKSITAKPKGK